MTYEEFHEIMSTRGITEFAFSIPLFNEFDDCRLGVAITEDFTLLFWYGFLTTGESYQYSTLDEMLDDPVFAGKTLKEIWQSINIIDIDGVEEEEYLPENFFNYYEYIDKIGNVVWNYKPSNIQILLYVLKIIIWVLIFFMLIGVLMAVYDVTNWNIMYFFGGISIFTLFTGLIGGYKANKNLRYIVTDKRIIKIMGKMTFEAEYSFINKILLKYSLFNKTRGTIKIFVKKGLSSNYHFVGVDDVDKKFEQLMYEFKKSNNFISGGNESEKKNL